MIIRTISDMAARSLRVVRLQQQSVAMINRRSMSTRQAVLHIPKPTETPLKAVLAHMKRLRPSKEHWPKFINRPQHAIVILATPSFASHLEAGSGFIPKLLKTINRHSEEVVTPFKVDVVCGVVDGLPPRLDEMSQARSKPVSEGFSVLYGETEEILPKYLHEKEDEVTESKKPGSITFEGTREDEMSVTLPLANTLFKNGRLSTLLASKWEAKGDEYTQIEAQVNINSVSVNNLDYQTKKQLSLYVPGIPLTYARKLEKGYGNIIRSLEFRGADRVDCHPASAELEVKVPRYLKEVVGKPMALKIWALSIPLHLVQKSIQGSASTLRLPDKDFKVEFPIKDYTEIGGWISRGATLCRVQSGGGGWGPKAGLLSLDPETTYSHTQEASVDMDDIFFKENDNHHLADVAQPGSYIQFFTNRESSTRGHKQHIRPHARRFKSSTILGSIPSSIDSMDKSSSQEEELGDWKVRENLVISEEASRKLHKKAIELLQVPFLGRGRSMDGIAPEIEADEKLDDSKEEDLFPGIKTLHFGQPEASLQMRCGEFGFVSELGMFIKQVKDNETGEKVESKIDIPFSYFHKTFGVGKSKEKKALSSV